MTTALQLIGKLGAVGIKLWLDEDNQLRFKAPKGAFTSDLKDQLLEKKTEIISFLQEAKNQHQLDSIPRLDRNADQTYPLSFAQQRFWFLNRLEPGNPSLHIAATLRITGSLNIEYLRQSFELVVARQESLRTGFITNEHNIPQQIIFTDQQWKLSENYDLSHLSASKQQSHIEHIMAEEALRPFELESKNSENSNTLTPLLRTRLARLTDISSTNSVHILFLTLHHIIADGWSIGLLINELTTQYATLLQGGNLRQPELEIQYIDYSQWQRNWIASDKIKDQLAYWKMQLKNAPVLELPTDFVRPKQTSYNGANYAFTIDPSTTLQIKKIALQNQSSVFITLLGTFQLLLSHYSQQKDICVGTPISGRNRQDIENIIGCFINLLAIRSNINHNEPFLTFLDQLKNTFLVAQENQDTPFELVAEHCTEYRSFAHTPIFQTLFTYQINQLHQQLKSNYLDIEVIPQPSLTSKYEIQLHISEEEKTLNATIEFNTDLFSLSTIKDFARHFNNLLKAICQNPEANINQLSIFDATDLAILAPKSSVLSPHSSLLDLLTKQLIETPHNIAVSCGEQTLTYVQLHESANALAHILIAKNIGPQHRVGICLHPSTHLMIAVLAVIKTGATYVPMDANYPDERLRHMMTNAEMIVVISESALQPKNVHAVNVILMDKITLIPQQEAPKIHVTPEQLFYIIYTSGSTGIPKGAGVSQRNVVNLLLWYIRHYKINDQEKVFVISSFGFDLTQKNLLAPLICGAEIIFSPAKNYEPQIILDTIATKKITWINCAPSAFYPIVETSLRIKRLNHLHTLRHVLFGGEPILLENLRPWLASEFFHAKITNMYGPTECTDITCAYTINDPLKQIGKSIPIGSAIEGVSTYVLDENRQLLPIGTAGELYIGGISVGTGYFGNPEMTNATFVKNPFSDGLMYRTKDVVRYCKSTQGLQLEFLSRIDDQIKIRGFRVELGEISSQLMTFAGVKEAVVIHHNELNSPQRLIAYYIKNNATNIDLHLMRDHLKAILPDYMIPSAYVEIEQWPLSPNGKIDKKALPKPSEQHSIQSLYIAPSTLTEIQLTELWQQALGFQSKDIQKKDSQTNGIQIQNFQPIGIHDNFFELGGHSLIATQLVGKIAQEFGIDIPLKMFFEKPTIAELAQLIDQGADLTSLVEEKEILPAKREAIIPLSFAQERLWIIEQINPNNSAYNIPFALHLKGKLHIPALKKALMTLVERHETLRTKIKCTTDGMAYQDIRPLEEFALREIELPNGSTLESASILFNQEANTAFDFSNDLLFRAQLLTINNDSHIFIGTLHHIIADGWSLGIFQNELQTIYLALIEETPFNLTPLLHQYADFAIWQREYLHHDHVQQHVDYWLDTLDNVPPFINLPSSKERPAQQTFNGAMVTKVLPLALGKSITQLVHKFGTTHFTLLLSAFALLLNKHSHQNDICIGTPVSGREKSSLQSLIGYFVNAVIIRNKLDGNPTLLKLLERTQDVALGAFAHQDVPIEQILDKLKINRNLSYPPIAQVGFSYISNMFTQPIAIPNLNIEPLDFSRVIAKYDLTLIAVEVADTLQLNFEYNTDLFDEKTIIQFYTHFVCILENFVTDPNQSINNISLLNETDLYPALKVNSSDVEAIYPLTPMQHDLVMSQLLQPSSLANTLGYRAEVDFYVDATLWQEAIRCVSNNQPITRMKFNNNFSNVGDFAYQCLYKNISLELTILDYQEEQLDNKNIQQRVDAFIYQPEQYTQNNFIRYGLMRLSANKTILLLSSHHALLDGISIVVIAELTAKYYAALSSNRDTKEIKQPNFTFPNYIAQSKQLIDSQSTFEFWKKQFANVEALDFPLDTRGKTSQQVVKQHTINSALWQVIKSYSRNNHLTPALLLKTLYCLLISNYCRSTENFSITEFNAGRDKEHALSLGCFFTSSPFIFKQSLLNCTTTTQELFSYTRDFRKLIKDHNAISAGLTKTLEPLGRLHFMFNYYHFFPQDQLLAGHPIHCIETPPFIENTVQFVIKEHPDFAQLDLYYQTNCFSDFQFLERLELLCSQLVRGKTLIKDLSYTLPNEYYYQTQHWNKTDSLEQNNKFLTSKPQSVQQLFEQQVSLTPNNIAIADDDFGISYSELNGRANQVAHFLHKFGVGTDVRVALCMPRCIDAMVIILGIIKAGGAYVPIDGNYPNERIDYMLESAKVDILFTQNQFRTRFENSIPTLICIDDLQCTHTITIQSESIENPENTTEINDLLYVIFTSGSTGQPKGATVTHKGEINLLHWYIREFSFNAQSRVLIISALGFDLTQKNLLAPLVSGGKLILTELTHYDSGAIHKLIDQHKITLINCAPSAFYPIIEDHTDYHSLQSLQYVILGGENIKAERLSNWFSSDACHAQLINNYGPTECTDIASFFRVKDPTIFYDQTIPIGKPNDNVKIYILNSLQQLLPTGLVGEICIAGAGVGRGYLNHDALNQEKFLPNPFGNGQLYRTGDLGKFLPDGNIEFVLRQDFQVKLNGLRIELGEIEHAIQHQSGVLDSLVLLTENQLIAYATCEKNFVNVDYWPTDLAKYLPSYMIPKSFILLDKWPLTPNGKIDRKALPAPTYKDTAVVYVAPRDEIEQVICTIVQNILMVERVGIHDNFFDLGGHSLAASRAIVQIREHFKIDIPLNVLFEMTTAEKLAAYIKAAQWAMQSAENHLEDNDRDTGFI